MTTLPIRKQSTDNIITLSVINGKLVKKPDVKYNKDGSIDKRHTNKISGVSSEVYPYTSKEEIRAMVNVFNERIKNASDENKKQIAYRNKMLFLIGINLGIRASDLCSLKYSFFMNNDGTFKEFHKLQPKKTRKTGKYVPLYFNGAIRKAITEYIEKYPIQDMDEYLFKSRKGDGAITERALWKIIVDATADAGIDKNVGSHTLRKTFGRFVFHDALDKNNALVMLQTIFNHSSPAVTSKYIGLTNDEVSDVFNSLDFGLDI